MALLNKQERRAARRAASVRRPGVVEVRGSGLQIRDIAAVAAGGRVMPTDDPLVLARIHASRAFTARLAEAGTPVYGVTTLFGGMADRAIPPEAVAAVQRNLVMASRTGAGDRLPVADVRAAMLLRANSLMRGVSGVRFEVIERITTFLNAGVTPHLAEFGSIGASGDLVPLAYIAGAISGVDRGFAVDMDGESIDATEALARLGLPPLPLQAKEGLGLINGTSVMTAIAANCVQRARLLVAASMDAHALMLQALLANNQSLHPFVHEQKPHPGQGWAAERMLTLMRGSALVQDALDERHTKRAGDLMQDRYSIRCLPQFLGPIIDGLAQIGRSIEIEANSATDNPLIEGEHETVYHCGNFLGQYVGVGMDQLRWLMGMTAKHLDVQIAMLVAPEFNRGLSPSLVGNIDNPVNIGLKMLQLTGNSIMPVLGFYGSSLADRFPTHAEQFNQNVNSQGCGSANLTRKALEIFVPYSAIALLFGVQAVDLRAFKVLGHYDARACLSPATVPLYEAVKGVVGSPASESRPLVWDDDEQSLDTWIAALGADLVSNGPVVEALRETTDSLERFAR